MFFADGCGGVKERMQVKISLFYKSYLDTGEGCHGCVVNSPFCLCVNSKRLCCDECPHSIASLVLSAGWVCYKKVFILPFKRVHP